LASDPNAVASVTYEWVGTSYYATVTWNSNFVGTCTIKFRAKNECTIGSASGDWSNEISYNITHGPEYDSNIDINGESSICPNSATSFSITSVPLATSYIWWTTDATGNVINIGSTSGTTNEITYSFNSNFTASSILRVSAMNRCVSSKESAKSKYWMSIAPKALVSIPSKPSSTSSVCATSTSKLTTTTTANATSYEWYISNSEAASLTTNVTTTPYINIDWNDNFVGGNVDYKVRAKNDCGYSSWSTQSSITVTPIPGICDAPTGITSVCQAAQGVSYSTLGSSNATSYEWVLTPSSAGTVVGTAKSITINFSSSFSGNVTLKVRGVNCTTGTFSSPLNITVIPSLGVPVQPTGSVELCQDASNCTYTVNSLLNATSYEWVLEPATAGTISGTGTSVTVDWSSSFFGNVSLKVRGKNSCGYSDYSPALAVTISQKAGTGPKPFGETNICQGTISNSYSISTPFEEAITYEWELLPSAAGTISGNGTVVSIKWASNFSGSATLRVRGINGCGAGDWTPALQIIINPLPSKPSSIIGSSSVCQGSTNISYSTLGASFANSYEWTISPIEAGTLTMNGSSCIINFSGTYVGTATLKVRGISCAYGEFSDNYIITVFKNLDQPSVPSGDESLCQDSPNTTYTIPLISEATNYDWIISPIEAGNLIKTGNSCAVNWSSTFASKAELSVKAINFCGSSSWSEPIEINIANIPAQASMPIISSSSACSGNPISISTNYILYADKYQWEITPKLYEYISDSTTNEIIIKPNNYKGLMFVGVKGINNCGEGPLSNKNYLSIYEAPKKPLFDLDTIYCAGETVDITVNNNDLNLQTNWFNNSDIITYSGNTFHFPLSQYSDNLYVQYSNQSNGCTSEKIKVDINVTPSLNTDFEAPITSIYNGNSITFVNKTENAIEYNWDFGDGLSSNSENPVHIYYRKGIYDISLVAKDAYECIDTIKKVGYIIVNGPTSNMSNLEKLGISFYPIPTNDFLYINTDAYNSKNDIQLELYSNNGQLLLSKKLKGGCIESIDVSSQTPGLYLIKINVNGIVSTDKLIIE
jgi:hypothetical protein